MANYEIIANQVGNSGIYSILEEYSLPPIPGGQEVLANTSLGGVNLERGTYCPPNLKKQIENFEASGYSLTAEAQAVLSQATLEVANVSEL